MRPNAPADSRTPTRLTSAPTSHARSTSAPRPSANQSARGPGHTRTTPESARTGAKSVGDVGVRVVADRQFVARRGRRRADARQRVAAARTEHRFDRDAATDREVCPHVPGGRIDATGAGPAAACGDSRRRWSPRPPHRSLRRSGRPPSRSSPPRRRCRPTGWRPRGHPGSTAPACGTPRWANPHAPDVLDRRRPTRCDHPHRPAHGSASLTGPPCSPGESGPGCRGSATPVRRPTRPTARPWSNRADASRRATRDGYTHE